MRQGARGRGARSRVAGIPRRPCRRSRCAGGHLLLPRLCEAGVRRARVRRFAPSVARRTAAARSVIELAASSERSAKRCSVCSSSPLKISEHARPSSNSLRNSASVTRRPARTARRRDFNAASSDPRRRNHGEGAACQRRIVPGGSSGSPPRGGLAAARPSQPRVLGQCFSQATPSPSRSGPCSLIVRGHA